MVSDHQLLVGPMQDAELRRNIERPAVLAGAEFEHGLVDVLLPAGDDPGTGPPHGRFSLPDREPEPDDPSRPGHAALLAVFADAAEGAIIQSHSEYLGITPSTLHFEYSDKPDSSLLQLSRLSVQCPRLECCRE
jgi:hypothetical protein